jgi:hypothetical protein
MPDAPSYPAAHHLPLRGGLVAGLLARGLSPNPYLFWFLVGGPSLIQIQADQDGWWAVAAFLIGYYVTIIGSNVGLALAVHRWIGAVSDRVYRGVLLVSSLVLAMYGLLLIGRLAQRER